MVDVIGGTFKTNTYCKWLMKGPRWLNQYFSYIMATSFSGGRSRSTRREPPTMGKQLVNFITCSCEPSAPFFVIYKAGGEPKILLKVALNTKNQINHHHQWLMFWWEI
jgi:hypothetical protein